MNMLKSMLVVLFVVGLVMMISGCSADSDSLFSLDVDAKILPKTRLFAGKPGDAKKVSDNGRKESILDTAMGNGLANTPEKFTQVANASKTIF